MVSVLFNENRAEHIFKKTTYKTILKTELCNTPCFVKRYTNTTAPKLIKSFFRTPMSLNEFTAANYIVDKGIATPQPLLLAEHKNLEQSEKVCSLSHFWKEHRILKTSCLTAVLILLMQKKIFYEFGNPTKEIFKSKIYHDDYSINNFIYDMSSLLWHNYIYI